MIPFTKRVDTGGGSAYPAVVDGEHETSLEWVLRYGSTEQVIAARFDAAAIVHAYQSLVIATRDRREQVVRAIRAAMEGT